MGWGDEILASGQARRMQAADPRRVQVLDYRGAARWSPIWDGNPRIARPGELGDFQKLQNGPGVRPMHLVKTPERWLFDPTFRAEAGEIYFSNEERAFAAPFDPLVVVEPTIKPQASRNKHWGDERWLEFAGLAKRAGLELVQLGDDGKTRLPGVELIRTPGFRLACAVLARARLYIGHEGGLHHAAAALGVRAVVIFGGFISPDTTGYAMHRNLGVPFRQACGRRIACGHCGREMAKISPRQVLEAALEQLEPAAA